MKKFLRGPGAYVFILLVVLFITTIFSSPTPQTKTIDYTEFMTMFAKGDVAKVEITDNNAKVLEKGSQYAANFPSEYDYDVYIPSVQVFNDQLTAIFEDNEELADIPITYKPKPEPNWFISSLPYLLMSLLMIGFFWYMLNQQGQGGSKVMSFGKSRARVNTDDKNKKTFEDVAGADEEKEELQEIVDFLKNPRKFSDLGARIPKGVLLVGPPGTGKTLLAKAVAGEAGVPFYSISGSDFVEMFVGVGASRVRDLFDTAKKNTPSMVFIDEIDAVGRHRGAGLGGGHDEREQTLNQLLVEMDGFAPNEGIIIIAATNRPDILDPALLRPGRFDRQITVNYPDAKGREEILKVHARGKPIGKDVDLKVIAKRTPWQTGADLENILNEAAILTARRNKQDIGMKEVLEAINRVEIGPEKKSSVVTEKDKKLVSYHETGHAIVAHMLEHCDPVHEVSIIPRGQAGGYTQTLPGEETRYMTKGKLLDRITMSMGGRAAEELMIGEISTGATGDLKMASQTAKAMVVEYGMSEAIGNIYYGGDQEVFLGRDYGHAQSYSEEVAAAIDKEVKRILDNAYSQAIGILRDNRDKMEDVVKVLLEKEKLDGDEFIAIIGPSPFEKNYEVVEEIKRVTERLGLSEENSQTGINKGDSAERTDDK